MNKQRKTGESLKDMFKNNVKQAKRSDVKTSKRQNAKTVKPKNSKESNRNNSKTSKSKNVLPSKNSKSETIEKNKHTIYLPKDISKKLQYEKIERESTLSEIIEELLRKELDSE